ncbi:MAG: tetratricopeptide repeat protein, partial [Nitrospiraceae bacterium]
MYKSTFAYTVIFIALFICMALSPAYAQNEREDDPGYIFYKANALYEDGKYDEAIEVYTSLIDQGRESGNLYYNIGNSYFKKGELGKAIVNYERANKLIPDDSDLKSNHDFARSKVRNTVSGNTASFHGKVMALYKGFSINGLTIILSVLFIVLLSYIFIAFVA